MLRKHTKQKVLEYLKSAEVSKEMICEAKKSNIDIFSECQQNTIYAGNILELCDGEEKNIVPLLEEYCEELYQASLHFDEADKYQNILAKLHAHIMSMVNQLDVKYQVVFMPYKASMWDSLESIYLAAKEDPKVECLLVPIPYFNLADQSEELQAIYEGEHFPDGEIVTSYLDYDLKEQHPDVIYIHNPYDDYNNVTSVHPAYYSVELKKYTDQLVYVPYYVTAGFFSFDHRYLSVYKNMDYMIAQSDFFKSEAEGLFYEDKMLPLGSPKLDKVINTCKHIVEIPEHWKAVLAGRKSVMLNTSLNCILYDSEAYLDKLNHLFDWFRNHSEVVLVWRPHPLLEATFRSLRPTLYDRLKNLIDSYKEEQIGIFDDTPEIAKTIAIVDAYIGEDASSVVNLFGAAGKPLFILNNNIYKSFSEEEKRKIHVEDMCKVDDKIWISTSYGLFVMEKSWEELRYIDQKSNQSKWIMPYPNLSIFQGNIILSPYYAKVPKLFEPQTEKMQDIQGLQNKTDLKFKGVATYKNQIFFLPYLEGNDYIYEYNEKSGTWNKSGECIKGLMQGCEETIYECTYAHAVYKELLYICATYTNRILIFNMETRTHKYFDIGAKGTGFSGIVVNKDELWLTEIHSGVVLKLNMVNGQSSIYPMPDSYMCWQANNGRYLANSALIQVADWIITIPGFSNKMVMIQKETGEIKSVHDELWQIPNKAVNGYRINAYTMVSKAIKMDEHHVLLQRYWDGKIVKINVDTNAMEMYDAKMSKESLQRLLDGEDGFEKIDTVSEFSRKESALFSFEDFMTDLCDGKLETALNRQKRELSTLAANLDGSCGEKVHAYMMHVLKEKNESI